MITQYGQAIIYWLAVYFKVILFGTLPSCPLLGCVDINQTTRQSVNNMVPKNGAQRHRVAVFVLQSRRFWGRCRRVIIALVVFPPVFINALSFVALI
jgi:hypothetical protein